MSEVFYVVGYAKQGLSLELRVNDVPIERLADAGQVSSAPQVNLWVRPGQNEVTVHTPDSPEDFEPGASVNVRVYAAKDGDSLADLEPIASVHWPVEDETRPTPDGMSSRSTLTSPHRRSCGNERSRWRRHQPNGRRLSRWSARLTPHWLR